MNEIPDDHSAEELPLDFDSLTAYARAVEKQRVTVTKSKFEDVYQGTGDFAETGLYDCGSLFGIRENGEWTFRHISDGSGDYVEDATKEVVGSFSDTDDKVSYRVVAGNPAIAGKIKAQLLKMNIDIPKENEFVEKTDPDQGGYHEKILLYLKERNRFIVLLTGENKIIDL